jgi:hypothetical protein
MKTSPHERVGASYAGLLGYFSGRTVVNLDGLVNSANFFSRVMAGNEWESYLQENHITWLAGVGCGLTMWNVDLPLCAPPPG